MSGFDDLPKRDRNHKIESKALAAFQSLVEESGCFVLQAADRRDYGTDCQLEVAVDGQVTNARIHVQLKGTEQPLNADGSISIQVQRTNLNYLLMQPYSFYACFHLPTGSLRICPTSDVLIRYDHGGRSWMDQQTITVHLAEELTVGRMGQLAGLARTAASAARDRRVNQSVAGPADLSSKIVGTAPEVYVPEDRARAIDLLQELYVENADDVISASFDRFLAILGSEDDNLATAYMAEVNLGMAGRSRYPGRIEDGIAYFRSKLGGGRIQPGSIHYNIGNAYSALHKDEDALCAFRDALAEPWVKMTPGFAAQVHKNLGTSLERLGEIDEAVCEYRTALRLDPNLAEAHNAMGQYYVRIGQYLDALTHLDQVVYSDRQQRRMSAVTAWRANALFNLGDGRAAFRDINALAGLAESEGWVWPWCVRLVGSFGRTSVDNAVLARAFWQRYVQAKPESVQGRWELLMSAFYLRGQGHDLGMTLAEFRPVFDQHIAAIEVGAALPWDRFGHWAQDDGDWTEAERSFRKAYELEGEHYGYCLGVALNHLNRFEESLPILLEQANSLQPDAMSWFQVAVAHAGQGQLIEAVGAFKQAVALDPTYALAKFELGGALWNAGKHEQALETWVEAFRLFPEDEHVSRILSFLGDVGAGKPDDKGEEPVQGLRVN